MTGFTAIASWDPTWAMGFQFEFNERHAEAFVASAPKAAASFHRQIEGYVASELRDAPELAQAMRVGRVLLKVETDRFGLPAFKILGASWAAERLLAGRNIEGITLITATDGNHGRGVARVARMRVVASHILVPTGTPAAR